MDDAMRQGLEASGYVVGDYGDFLEMTDGEWLVVELRARLAEEVRRLRTCAGVTQRQLAERMGSSQSRVAKIELGAVAEIGTELMLRAYFELGGRLDGLSLPDRLRPANTSAPGEWAPVAKAGGRSAKTDGSVPAIAKPKDRKPSALGSKAKSDQR